MFIKPYTKKLLKELEDVSKWEDSLFCVRHKQEWFEVWVAFPFNKIWGHEEIRFNIIEKFLIWIKVSKVKRYLRKNPVIDIKFFQT